MTTLRAIGFADLFDNIGTLECRFSPRAETMSGETVEIEGFLAPVHGEHRRFLLVANPGECPDCAPTPTPAIFLPDVAGEPGSERVAVRGTISYGFEVDSDGTASFLRLTGAAFIAAQAADPLSSIRF